MHAVDYNLLQINDNQVQSRESHKREREMKFANIPMPIITTVKLKNCGGGLTSSAMA
jgi:hypothetical protein